MSLHFDWSKGGNLGGLDIVGGKTAVNTDDWKPETTREEDILRYFYAEVCAEAEKIMAQTGTVSGAHYNAMKRVLKRKGIEVQP